MGTKRQTRYVIGKNTYEKHIDNEAHLYEMLHQLSYMAKRVKDAEGMASFIDAAQRYGEIADTIFDTWGIPNSYLIFGDKKDLNGMKEKELEKLSDVLKDHDAQKLSEAVEQASWNLPYIIHGSRVRMLVSGFAELLSCYYGMARRVMEAKTGKDFARLKTHASRNERMIRRICRTWGVPEGETVASYETLKREVQKKYLIPVHGDSPELACEQFDFGDLNDLDTFEDPDELYGGWDG